jgi:hypothetical protein
LSLDGGSGAGSLHPALTPGVWKNITPANLNIGSSFGIVGVAFDPCNRSVLYTTADQNGMWKSVNGGMSWTLLGNKSAPFNSGNTHAEYLDSPVRVVVDPKDSTHIYATQGVRGNTFGFWVSKDSGNTWDQPAGFAVLAATTAKDIGWLDVDPGDFGHVVLGSHSPWPGFGMKGNAGVMEGSNALGTWVAHPPETNWPSGTIGVNFLHDPVSGTGSGSTWVVSTDGVGIYRTVNAGTSWGKVSTEDAVHGGAFLYRAKNGTLYLGGNGFPLRSTDNGLTWHKTQTGLPYGGYYSVQGDGKYLYTTKSGPFAGPATPGQFDQPYFVSLESDGLTWTPYQGGAQTFPNGPYFMVFDSVDRILYSANWAAGLWALKVLDP